MSYQSMIDPEPRTFAVGTVRPFRNVLVAVDDSLQSLWALETAKRLAGDAPARIALVHIINSVPGLTPEFAYAAEDLRPTLEAEASQLLHDAKKRLPENVSCDEFVREGDPAYEIVSLATLWHADVIVIGTHGRGLLGRVFLGSVAASVVRHAPCPVMTVANEPPTIDQASAEGVEGHSARNH